MATIMVFTNILTALLVVIMVLISIPAVVISQTSSLSTSSLDNDATQHKAKTITDDFSDGYWVRVAQAKVLALAVENGALPRLDENSTLMKPACCQVAESSVNNECHKFTQTCAEEEADKIAFELTQQNRKSTREDMADYMNTILRECGQSEILDRDQYFENDLPPPNTPHPHPVFHCNKYEGQKKVLTNFRMEYHPLSSSPSSTHTTLTDLIPRYFVIEMEVDGHWLLPPKSVQALWLFSFQTNPDHRYKIRVTAVSPKFVYPPVTSPLVAIYNTEDLTIRRPVDLHVVNVTLDETTKNPKPSALMRWESGSGQNASCDASVYIRINNLHIIDRKMADEAFWVKFDNLDFQKNYSVQVIEKFGGGFEANVISDLFVPSCLEMRRYSFDLCPPPPPQNIRIENETEDSFLIVWDPPKYTNSTNRLLHYTLTARWNDTDSDGRHAMVNEPQFIRSYRYIRSKIVDGEIAENETSFLVENVGNFGGRYEIAITAVGKVGSSVAEAEVYHAGTPFSESHFWQMWAIQTAFCLVVGFIMFQCLRIGINRIVEEEEKARNKRMAKL